MATQVIMPDLGESVTEPVLLKWLKQEGDPVQAGMAIAEVELDKSIIELEATASGILRKILVPEGSKILAGVVLAIIGDAWEDLTELTMFGVNPPSKVLKQLPEPPIAGKEQALTAMRSVIMKRMSQSKSTIPHYYLTMEIDMAKAAKFRAAFNQSHPHARISINDILIKVAALSLLRHPAINASFQSDRIIFHNQVDIAFAVAVHDGLITPVIRHCESKSLEQIAQDVRVLAKRAKERKLMPEEYSNATFSISNLGMYGIEEFSAIINPPAAAMLAAGAVVEKPVVENGQIVIGHRMKVTLSCDHRVIDGAVGVLFLREVKKIMEDPAGVLH